MLTGTKLMNLTLQKDFLQIGTWLKKYLLEDNTIYMYLYIYKHQLYFNK